MGIGSEGWTAMKTRRKFIGCELKESYWKQAVKNISQAEDTFARGDLLTQMETSAA